MRVARSGHRAPNYLFASADSGGKRATAICSLIGTAKLNGIDAEAHLRTGLARIAGHPINWIEGLQLWKMTYPTS